MPGQAHRALASDVAPVILVINAYGQDSPGRIAFEAAFSRTLRQTGGAAIDLYFETLDTNRFRGEAQQRVRRQLREKYANRKLSVVVAVYAPALDFLADPKDPPFPGVPIAASLARYPERVPPGVAFTWSDNAVSETLRAALTLRPGARRIAVIDSGPEPTARDLLASEMAKQIESVGSGLPVDMLRNLPLDEVLERVRALPSDTIILMARQTLGRGGVPIGAVAAFREIAAAAPAPAFVTAGQQIGSGAVGGMVVDVDIVGSDLAGLVLRVAEAGSTANISPVENRLMATFDWRALQRWNISESALPAGSVVLFREVALWDQYRGYIIGAFAILIVQSGLLAAMFASHTRRRRAEEALRQLYDQNRDLAGRLINAQEAERGRIARDLHDDVSQQLAGLAIMMSGLKQKIGKQAHSAEIDESVATIQELTTTLAQSVRNLSHELHPDVLQHAGLVPTLRRHCAEIAKVYSVTVEFTAHHDTTTLGQEDALCLFRVAQEAITNAVRHAWARTIRVDLREDAGHIELCVADDGVGFAADRKPGKGLGLRSIDERVRLVRGSAAVFSTPGVGTTVRVRIPQIAA